MARNNKLIFFNNTVYGLSKDYGFVCALYRPTETINYQTGTKTIVRVKYPIKKAIFFPNQLFRDFKYASLFGNDMQFGGILDTSQRVVLINKKYLPKGFKIETTDYIIFNGNRFEIQKIDEMELANYWLIIIKQVYGSVRMETFDRKIKDKIEVEELTETVP